MNKIIPMVNSKNKTRSNLGGIAVTGMDDNGVINKTSGNVGTDESKEWDMMQ